MLAIHCYFLCICYPQRAVQSLKELLEQPRVLQLLDENTDLNKKKSVIWDDIFQGVKKYMVFETQQVLKLEEKGASSASAISNRQRRKKVLCSVFVHR